MLRPFEIGLVRGDGFEGDGQGATGTVTKPSNVDEMKGPCDPVILISRQSFVGAACVRAKLEITW